MSFRRRHRWLRRLALGFAAVAAVAGAAATAASARGDDGAGVAVYASAVAQPSVPVRPDDAADRFAHSNVPVQPQPARSGAWAFERGDAAILAVGTIVLAFGLALALGSLRRPRFAGL